MFFLGNIFYVVIFSRKLRIKYKKMSNKIEEFVIPIHPEELLLKRKERYYVENQDILPISESVIISRLDGLLSFLSETTLTFMFFFKKKTFKTDLFPTVSLLLNMKILISSSTS